MPGQDKPTLDYRHGEEQARIIESEIIPHLDKYRSESDFTRKAIHNQAREIRHLSQGGKTAKRLINLLDNVRGVDENFPDRSSQARMKDEDLAPNTSISLEAKVYHILKEIIMETNLDRSKTTRYCVIGQLSKIAKGTDVLAEWQEDACMRTWTELKLSLSRPKRQLYYVLAERFILSIEETEYFVREDPTPFEHFAESYREDFYDSQAYNELKDQLGDRVFNNVENTIEEYTSLTMESDSDSGFLEEYLDE